MRTENIGIKITISIPYDKPDLNGNIYTKEAVENAVNHLRKNLPIIFRDESEEKVIGTTTGDSHIVTWDFDNQVYKLTVDGEIFFGGTECIVNEMENCKATSFEIVGLGLSK